MLFLILKNVKDFIYSLVNCLLLALATHTKKIKSFDGKEADRTKCLEVMFVTITNFKK